ncbi:unnamed protein product [Moneuplotes crassus]|uniref:Coronin n=1 Tax=Euplotes crassus TaxID=5936 RepID=A0AAD1X3S0_EUPCR|nr:unnamed protein product [Moneuplotes crassus]
METGSRHKSKYKYLDGKPFKEKFTNLLVPNATDSKFVDTNGFFTAMPWKAKGGGQLAIMKVDDYKKFHINDPMLKGHLAPISAFEFNPFVDTFLATASEDGTSMLWNIPIEGLTEDLKEPNATLYGHSKKITHLTFNPTASNVMLTASFDKDIRIWDVSTAKEALHIPDVIGQPTSIEWNYDGSLVAAANKNKSLYILDPRDPSGETHVDKAHNGPKQLKVCWLGSSNKLLTTGTNKQMFKELGVWDTRDLSSPLKIKKDDKILEVVEPFFDDDKNLVFTATKGERRVNMWELADDDEVIHKISSWTGEGCHRGFNLFPKRFVDVYSSEFVRAVRLTEDSCEYVSFGLPSKQGAFVSSLYGQCSSGNNTCDIADWKEGKSAAPDLVDINPDLLSSLQLRTSDGVIVSTNDEEEEKDEVADLAPTESTEDNKANYLRKITKLENRLREVEEAPKEDSEEVKKLRQDNEDLQDKIDELESRISDMDDSHKQREEELQKIIQEKEDEIQRLLQNQTQATYQANDTYQSNEVPQTTDSYQAQDHHQELQDHHQELQDHHQEQQDHHQELQDHHQEQQDYNAEGDNYAGQPAQETYNEQPYDAPVPSDPKDDSDDNEFD